MTSSAPSAPSHPSNLSTRALPKGWRWVKLGDACRVVGGSTPSSGVADYWDGDIVWVTPTDLGKLGCEEIADSARKITKAGYDNSGTELVPIGSVVMSSRAPIGYLGIAKTPLCTNQGCKTFVPKDEMDSRFLYYSLKGVVPILQSMGSGATFAEISKGALENFAISLPPLPEQRRIAGILKEQMTAVEKARAAAEAQLQAAKALPAAYLREVFPATDAPLPQGWRWVKLGEVCEREVQNKDPHETRNIPFRYIDISSVDNVRKSIVSPQTLLGAEAPSRARQVVRTNDVLVSATRPNLNAVAIVPPELDQMICSTGFCVLRPTIAIDPTFLFLFVQSKEFVESLSSLVVGALYPAVKDSQVKDQLIPLPPLPEQRRIAGILKEQMAAVEKARAAAEAQLSEINALPSALLRQAFSGLL